MEDIIEKGIDLNAEQSDSIPENVLQTIAADETVSVVVPLYGYWKDNKSDLDKKTLQATMLRLKSFYHKAYYIFVVEKERLSDDIVQMLQGYYMVGNSRLLEVDSYANYPEFIDEGIKFALEETESRFIVVANPWIILRENSLDLLLERLNKGDVSMASGYDIKRDGVDPAEFDTYVFNPPHEIRDFNVDFFGFTRTFAQMLPIDMGYRTQKFVSRDLWQTSFSRGMEVISSQHIPFWSFDIGWDVIESEQDYVEDKKYFMSKWNFDPSIEADAPKES